MGRPYASELRSLAATYRWAGTYNVEPLAKALSTAATVPLLSTGSGGSLTAAHFAALLHHRCFGWVAKAVTPLELVAAPELRRAAVLLLTASGGNGDILDTFRHVVTREPYCLTALCATTGSRLSALATLYRQTEMIEFDSPAGKDGFLATNSLLAFTVLLYRAYLQASDHQSALPAAFVDLVHPGKSEIDFVGSLRAICLPLWERPNTTVLFGPSVQIAAVDLESKFTESALGALQMADYRNFAHGRHHWLAKHGMTTGVLAIVTNDDRSLAERTIALLPPQIPITRIDVGLGGPEASIAALATVFHVVGLAGEARGIDPGRPGVPLFGSKLYKMRISKARTAVRSGISPIDRVAIERKASTDIQQLAARNEFDFWLSALDRFADNLRAPAFGGVVLDYDGTLCDQRDRYAGLRANVVSELTRLLDANLCIGIATGRGKSVKKALRAALPQRFWERVVIGYYNGSDIGSLVADDHPDGAWQVCDALYSVADALMANRRLTMLAECTPRLAQLTIEPRQLAQTATVADIVEHIVRREAVDGVQVVHSSHSIDVLAPGVSKCTLVHHIRALIHADDLAVLCIGDRGRWPGNDFALLAERYSLSVDQVSPDPETCWNLAPPGIKGVQALEGYLGCLAVTPGKGARLQVEGI